MPRGERIRCDFLARAGNRGQQYGFADVGIGDQHYVRHATMIHACKAFTPARYSTAVKEFRNSLQVTRRKKLRK
jgi:hypothetical protein